MYIYLILCHVFFFFNDTATTEIYTLSLHDALPILAGCQRLPHLGGHPLAADPGRIPGDEVEPAARQDVGEMGFEREERGTALTGEAAGGRPELAATGAHPPEQRALVRAEPPAPSGQVAILAR